MTVSAVDSKGKQVGVAITKTSGNYFLYLPRPDRYSIYFSFVGYGTVSQRIEYKGKTLDLGVTTLKPGLEIEQIYVAARPLVRKQSDRIVFDVGKDPEIGKFKMMGIMSKIPDLEMSPGSGNLRYNGQAIEAILIDKQDNDLINSSRQYPMEFIRADYMAQIELILPGSPEYNNDKPIINIKLSRPLPYGIAGEIRPNASSERQIGSMADLVMNTPFTGVGVNYRFGFSDAPKLENRSTRENLLPGSQIRTTESNSESGSMSRRHDLTLTLFRPVFRETGKIRLKVNTSLSENTGMSRSSSESYDDHGTQAGGNTSASRSESRSPMRLNGGLGFSKKWQGLTSSGTLSLGYEYTDNRTQSDQITLTTPFTDIPSDRKSNTVTGSDQHALKATYLLISGISPESFISPTSRMFYITTGYVNRLYTNSSQYYRYDELLGEYREEEERFNGLNYRQEIYYAILRYNGKFFTNKLSWSAQLQGEHLSNKGNWQGVRGGPLDYHEFNVIPNLNLAYKYKNNAMTLGYTGMVRRPNPNQLNPYVDDSNPENIRTGNPGLRGEYTHNPRIGIDRYFGRKSPVNRISFAYQFNYTGNAIEQITTIDEKNISYTTYENLGQEVQNRLSFGIFSAPFIKKKVSLSLSLNYAHKHYRFHDGENNITQNLSGAVSLTLNRIKDFNLRASYSYAPAFSSAQNRTNSYYSSMDISLGKYFSKAHLGCNLSVSDLLNGHKFVKETIGNDMFLQNSYRERLGRVVRVSLYWRFGKFSQTENPGNIDSGVYDMGE